MSRAEHCFVDFLRDHLGLTGTHVGCDTSQCGACVVHVNGNGDQVMHGLRGCLRGEDVTTIEGLAKNGKLHPMQEAFQRISRAAVRLLHARDDHGERGHRAAARQDPR